MIKRLLNTINQRTFRIPMLFACLAVTFASSQRAWAGSPDPTSHGELVSAINNASDGGTVTIGANFSLEENITVDKDLTIDFNNHLINSSGYTIIVSNHKTLILTSENQGGVAGAAVTFPVSLAADGKAYLKNNAYAEGIAYSNAVVKFTNPSQSDGFREAYFNSLSDAVAATSTYACTLKLYDDVTDVASSISLGNEAGVALDLNGKKLQGQLNSSGSIITVPANMKLTITDSGTGGLVWNNTDRTGNCFAVDNYGMLEIEGGTFQTRRGAANYVINNRNGATLTVSGGTIGKAKTNYIAIADDGGTTNISGGTIRFEQIGIECRGTLHVSGGTFDTTDSYSDTGTGIYFYGKEGNSFKITVLPTFQGKMGLNIAIEANGSNVPIDFTDAEAPIFTVVPANKLKIGYPDPTDGAYALTTGYSTHFVGEEGVIAPDEVFALPESAWGGLYLYNDEVYVAAATVTIAAGEGEHPIVEPFGTLAEAATAANGAEGAATIKMLADVYVSGVTLLSSAAGVTLDLNGHTIHADQDNPIIGVTGKATITDLTDSHQGKIENTRINSICVGVNEECYLTVNNVTIIGGKTAIGNSGTLTVGNATITAKYVHDGDPKYGIQNNGTLTFDALPDFSGNDYGIYIMNGSKIVIGGDITALPENFSRITLSVHKDYDDVELPFAFTNGYGAHCTINPADLFEYRNKNGECTVQLVAGEAVATAGATDFVAATKDADGNITSFYAQNGNDITTDAAALTAAVTALTDGETLTLCKDVEDVSETLTVSAGTDAAPVTIDLDGHTVTGSKSTEIFCVYNAITSDAHAVIKNGTVVNSNDYGGNAISNLDHLVLSNVSASGFYGIRAYNDVTLTAWSVFSGNLYDIVLGEGVNIVIGSDFHVPDTDYSPIKVDGDIGSAFTTGFSADAVGADVWQVFAGRSATYVVDADEQGQGVIYKCGKTLSFPSGLSTYYSAESLMPAGPDDDYSAFVVTGVTDGAVVVKQLPSGIIPVNTPVIVRNTSKNNHGLDFVTDQVAWKKTEYAATIASDLGGATLAEAFKGTAEDIAAYESVNGVTLYGLNGEAFVRLDAMPDIAAHRCWLEIPVAASAGTRTLTIVFGDGDTTGIHTPPLEGRGAAVHSEARYNLQGQRVADTYRGIVIQNGKKYMVR